MCAKKERDARKGVGTRVHTVSSRAAEVDNVESHTCIEIRGVLLHEQEVGLRRRLCTNIEQGIDTQRYVAHDHGKVSAYNAPFVRKKKLTCKGERRTV